MDNVVEVEHITPQLHSHNCSWIGHRLPLPRPGPASQSHSCFVHAFVLVAVPDPPVDVPIDFVPVSVTQFYSGRCQ